MLSNMAGFIISGLVHIALVTLLLNIAESPKPKPPKEKPVALTLAMFKPEAKLVPKPEKIIKKAQQPKKTEPVPVNKIKVAKAIVKPASKIQLKPKPVKRPKIIKPKPRKKLIVRKSPVKAKPKKIKRLKPKPKKVKTQKQRRIQPKPKPPTRRVITPVKRAIVHRPVRNVRRPSVLKRNVHQPVRQAVHRPSQRVVVAKKVSLKRVPHPPRPSHQRAMRKPVVKPVARVPAKKPRVKAAPVKPRAATTTHASGQVLKSYKTRLRQLIEASKRYPKRAKRRGEQGTVIVLFLMMANGMVKNISISKSSGSSLLDNAAKKAVSKVSGKLPFMRGINKKQWQFTVPVVYRLR